MITKISRQDFLQNYLSYYRKNVKLVTDSCGEFIAILSVGWPGAHRY